VITEADGVRKVDGTPGANAEPKRRSFEFTYKVSIAETPPGAKQLKVWLPYPKSDHNQEIFDIRISSPASATVYTEPRYGNAILYVSPPELQAAPLNLEMSFKVRRAEYLRKDLGQSKPVPGGALDPDVKKYLNPDRLVPVNEQVRQWSSEVIKGKKTDLEKARAIYDYTLATIKYDKSGEGWGRGDILYACDAKRGNCTDFHAVFIGFCRAAGIPARFEIGFPLPEKRGSGEISGYHCWAEFYLNGYGWVPVDVSEAWKRPEKREYFFGGNDENRVLFSIGRDIVLRPQQQSTPLNYFIYPYVEADGKPLTAVKKELYFKDLNDEGVTKVE